MSRRYTPPPMPQGEYLQYGGQAIIEGVMMRSPRYFAVACRAPNGEIVMRTEALEKTWIGRQGWLKKPFLRGTLALLDAMALGIKAMRFASNVQLDEKYQPADAVPVVRTAPTKSKRIAGLAIVLGLFLLSLCLYFVIPNWLARNQEGVARTLLLAVGFAVVTLVAYMLGASGIQKAKELNMSDDEWVAMSAVQAGKVQDLAIGATIVFSLFLGIGIFVYLPNLLAQPLQRAGATGTTINLAAGFIKAIVFFGYLWAIGRAKEIQEVFKYHGAEHKAINTLEANEELTMENCLRQTRLHPRCGTSFAIVVLLISIIVFTFVPRYPLGQSANIVFNATVRLFIEVLILPFIAGIAYELIRFAGKFKNNSYVRALFWPGLMSQYLTTREPEKKHVEVALKSLQSVVDSELGEKKEPPHNILEAAAQIA